MGLNKTLHILFAVTLMCYSYFVKAQCPIVGTTSYDICSNGTGEQIRIVIKEDAVDCFGAGQNDDLILGFSGGGPFQFDPGTESVVVYGDLTEVSSPTVSAGANTIQINNLTTTNGGNGRNNLDSIIVFVDVFATGMGAGIIERQGGSFSIGGSAAIPAAGTPIVSLNASQMVYNSTTLTQNATAVTQKTNTAELMQIQVSTTNGGCAYNMEEFNFNYTGMNINDISKIQVWYGGNNPIFNPATAVLFGEMSNPPLGMNIVGNAQLFAGNNYFYVTVDVPLSAMIGDTIDVELMQYEYGDNGASTVRMNGIDFVTPTSGELTVSAFLATILSIGDCGNPSLETTFNGLPNPLDQNYILELCPDYDPVGEAYPILFNDRDENGFEVIIRPRADVVTPIQINGTPANPSATLGFFGCDFLTIDGRSGGIGNARNLIIRNTTNNKEVIRFQDGAQNNNLNYVEIQGSSNANFSGLINILGSSNADGNSYNTISNSRFSDDAGSRPGVAIYSLGDAGKINTDNIITNNEFVNVWQGNSVTSYVLELSSNTSDWIIAGNDFYQTAAYGTNAFNSGFIFIEDGTDFQITNNHFGGTQPGALGVTPFTINNVTTPFDCIYFGPNAQSGNNLISNNTWNNIRLLSVSTATGGYPALSLIYNEGVGDFMIRDNTFGDMSGISKISIDKSGGTNGFGFTAITNDQALTNKINIINNSFGGITINGGNAFSETNLIYNKNEGTLAVNENTIGGTVANSIQLANNARMEIIRNASTSGGVVNNNVIRNITHGASTENLELISNLDGGFNCHQNDVSNILTDADGTIRLISHLGLGYSINDNSFENITCSGQGNTATFEGIYVNSLSNGSISDNVIGGTIDNNISVDFDNDIWGIHKAGAGGILICDNNIIQQIEAKNSTSSQNNIYGIHIGGGTISASGNTIQDFLTASQITSEAIAGFYVSSASNDHYLADNTIRNLVVGSNAGTGPDITGVLITGGNGIFERNYITDLLSNKSSSSTMLRGLQFNGTSTWDIFNNVIYMSNTNNQSGCQYRAANLKGTGSVNFYHNTVKVASTTNVYLAVCLYIESNGLYDVKNNVFQNLASATSTPTLTKTINSTTAFASPTFDNNFHENTGNPTASFRWSTVYDFVGWQGVKGAPGSYEGSESINDDGYASGGSLANTGQDLTGSVPDDKDGIARVSPNPWVGAYEGASPDYYWVGGQGNWSDASHWANSSGGTNFHAAPPTSTSNVFIDANSFGSINDTLFIDAFPSEGNNIDFTGTIAMVVTGNTSLDVYGDLTLDNNVQILFDDFVGFNFMNSTDVVFDSKGIPVKADLNFNGTGTMNLLSDLDLQGSINITSGVFSVMNPSNTVSFNISLTGDFMSNGTFEAGTGTVTFDGGAIGQNIMGFPAPMFYNLEINSSGGTTNMVMSMGGSIKTVINQLIFTNGYLWSTVGNEIRLSAGATTIGESASTHVVGALRREGTGSLFFPIGSGTKYNPVTLSNLSPGANEFTVEYYDTPHWDNGNLAVGLNNISAEEYWDISRNVGLSAADVTIAWANRDSSGIDNAADLSVVHYGTNWTDLGQSSITYAASGDITVNNISNFSPFTFGSSLPGANPLTVIVPAGTGGIFVNDAVFAVGDFTTAPGQPMPCGSANAPCADINDAIGSANAGDTIFIDAGTYLDTDGFTNIMVNQPLTFIGFDSSLTILNGQGTGRGFELQTGDVSFSNMTMTNYDAGAQNGGAIAMIDQDGILSLDHMRIDNSSAEMGGAIAVEKMSAGTNVLFVTNSCFFDNLSIQKGGALFMETFDPNATMVMVIDSSEIGGAVGINLSDLGGGVYFDGDTLYLTNSHVENESTTDGGGIFHDSRYAWVQNVDFENNTTGDRGGAIFSVAGDVDIFQSQIGIVGDGNSASEGGGVWKNAGNMAISQTNVRGNSTTTGPGGAIAFSGDSLFVDSSSISFNTSGNNGGAIALNQGVSIITNQSEFEGNTATQNGGAIYSAANTTLLVTQTIIGTAANPNTALRGGGISSIADTMMIDSCIIRFNTATQDGAGIEFGGNVLFGLNSIFNGNVATSEGGAVYSVAPTSKMFFTHIDFRNNDGGSRGGALYSEGILYVDSSNIGFTGNPNDGSQGGGIYFNGDTLIMDSCRVVGNTATSGGALYLGNSGPGYSEINKTEIYENQAPSSGGAIYSAGRNANIFQSIIRNNTSNNGGAFYSANSAADASIENTLIYRNSGNTEGGGIRVNSGDVTLTNATVVKNTSAGGGGISVNNGTAFVINTISYFNDNDDVNITGTGSVELTNTLFGSNMTGTIDNGGNIAGSDPLFVDTANANYLITVTSPAFNSANVGQAPAVDINDTLRPQAGLPDMGAYEIDAPIDTIIMGLVNGDTLCVSSTTYQLDFSAFGTFNAGNIFIVQFSDATGSFAAPTNLDSLVTSTPSLPETISVTLNESITPGNAYRVRIVSTNMAYTSNDNGSDFVIFPTETLNWVGGTVGSETDWFNCNNWVEGRIPGQNSDVNIPNGAFYPTIINGIARVQTINIDVDNGASISIDVDNGGQLEVYSP